VLVGGLYERASGAAGRPLAGYRRRTPERTVLYELVAQHAQTMLAELRDADPDGGGLPRYVERELAAYLKYRQWVFTVPKPLRLVLARDPEKARWVGQLVVRAIGAWQRRVARARGLVAPRTGAVVFRQRFGGLVNLNVHYHLVIPDGVFIDDGEHLRFVMLAVPSNQDVLAILDRIVRRLARRLAAEAPDDDDTPPMSDVLAQVQIEAATTWRAPSDRGDAVRGAERLRAWNDGFSLHAGVVIAEHDRDALERLCRYGARPAFAQEPSVASAP
jgi:hypothetical protein